MKENLLNSRLKIQESTKNKEQFFLFSKAWSIQTGLNKHIIESRYHMLTLPFICGGHCLRNLLLFSCKVVGEGNGTPLQYSCLENPMDGGAWTAAVHGVTEGRTRLSDFTFTFHFPALEKEMATHSSVLAWRIPGTGEPGGLPSVGSHRVGHD